MHGFSKEQMKELLKLASNDSLFIFNNNFYIQKDGCAMGSPIGPSFANAFLCNYEKIWISECPLNFKPLYYRRYVDDTFLVFKHAYQIPLFLDYMNDKHRNIQFTHEIERNGQIAFLDVCIKNTNEAFTTSIYRKHTFTGLSSKFTSFIPMQYKRNLISTLIFRCYNLCSSYENIYQEIIMLNTFYQTMVSLVNS